MIKDGKVYHARLADHGGYIGRYTGNESGFPVYRFEGGSCHSSDADDRFVDVPGQEWVEEFDRYGGVR